MTGIVAMNERPGFGARLTIGLLRAMRAKEALDVADPDALRAAREKLDRFDRLTSKLHRKALLPFVATESRIAGVHALDLAVKAPVPPQDDRILLFIHGGGFFFRSIHGHMLLAARIAREAGIARAILPLYALAPEHVFPAAQEDCLAIYRGLLAQGVAADRIVLVADSAGANLALGMMVRARDAGWPMPHAAALLSPMTDLSYSGDSIHANAACDPMFGGVPMPLPGYYLGSADARDPRCSPLFADLTGLPPLLVQVGSTERLRDDSLRLEDAARAAGVAISIEVWRDMPHVFQAFDFREARAARARIGAFLRSR
jgi:acetyl esterase/lipase